MSDHESFTHAILAQPDDEHLRLVYADWLEERADPRGEFIRVQTLLADAALEKTQRSELLKREHELWALHHKDWLGPLEPLVIRSKFRRGFVEDVEMNARQFIDHAEAMYAVAPIRAVTLWDAEHHMADLAASSSLARLRHLGFAPEDHRFVPESNSFSTPAVHMLVSSPHLAHLRSLRFHGNDLTISEVREIAAAPTLANLEKLNLDGNDRTGDLSLAALMASPHLRHLKRLSLATCGLTASGVAVLARSPFLAQLTALRLNHNRIGNEGLRALAASRHVKHLRALRLKDTGINALGVVALTRAASLANLEILDLSDNPVSDRAGELAQAVHFDQLRELNLRGTHLTRTGVARLQQRFGDRVQF